MTVSLNIENDVELRAYIKDLIKGQVLKIVREELLQTIKSELERKVKGMDSRSFDYMVREQTKTAIKEILHSEFNVSQWNTEFIKPFVDSQINTALTGKDWKSMVDTLAKEKVKSLIQ